MPASNRGPSLLGALKLSGRPNHNLVQASKGHSSATCQSALTSEGNPLISKPILQSSTNPLSTPNQPHQQQHQQQSLPTGKKVSEQSVEDFQLDSFDDSDSESDVEYKPAAKVVNSTPSVMDKKLPGLSFSFDKAAQFMMPKEKEREARTSGHKTVPPTMVDDAPAKKEAKGLSTEKVENGNVKEEDTSSNFDSSPPLSMVEDDHFKQSSSDSQEDDDLPEATAYVPSVPSALTKQSHRNPLTGRPQPLTATEKEKDKILELAQSSFLEMEDTSKKNDDLEKASKSKDTVDSGSPSHNLETFSPITPLPDQPNTFSMLSSDAKPTSKKTPGSFGTSDHAVGVMSPLSGSDSSLNTDSVIRQAEEIEQSMKDHTSSDQEVQDKVDLKSSTTTGHEKNQSEGEYYKFH